MKKISWVIILGYLFSCALIGCTTKSQSGNAPSKDTLKYAYKATYSSDITVPGNPANAQKVLQVWKMFETANIGAMKPYFADTVKYNAADGMHFYGPADKLLAYA